MAKEPPLLRVERHDLLRRDARRLGCPTGVNDIVVGVMPEGFHGLSFDTDVWIPIMMISAISPVSQLETRGARWLGAVARLKDGVTMADAQRDLDAVASVRTAAGWSSSC